MPVLSTISLPRPVSVSTLPAADTNFSAMSSTFFWTLASVSRSEPVAARTLSWMPFASITSIFDRIDARRPRTSSMAPPTFSTTPDPLSTSVPILSVSA